MKAPRLLVVTQIASNTLVNTKFLVSRYSGQLVAICLKLAVYVQLQGLLFALLILCYEVLLIVPHALQMLAQQLRCLISSVPHLIFAIQWIRHLGCSCLTNAFANHVFGNAIVMPGTETLVGSGAGTIFDANYINCSRGQFGIVSPVWSFTGNVGSHNTADSVSLESVFTDPEAASGFAAADWSLTGDVAATEHYLHSTCSG